MEWGLLTSKQNLLQLQYGYKLNTERFHDKLKDQGHIINSQSLDRCNRPDGQSWMGRGLPKSLQYYMGLGADHHIKERIQPSLKKRFHLTTASEIFVLNCDKILYLQTRRQLDRGWSAHQIKCFQPFRQSLITAQQVIEMAKTKTKTKTYKGTSLIKRTVLNCGPNGSRFEFLPTRVSDLNYCFFSCDVLWNEMKMR